MYFDLTPDQSSDSHGIDDKWYPHRAWNLAPALLSCAHLVIKPGPLLQCPDGLARTLRNRAARGVGGLATFGCDGNDRGCYTASLDNEG